MKATLSRILRILPFAVAAGFALLAAPPRILALYREFWEDEMLHNLLVLHPLGAPGVLGHIRAAYSANQPFFEYLLRKELWFPIAGWGELALRLPSLLSSLTLCALYGLFAATRFRRLSGGGVGALAVAVPAAWMAGHFTDIYYAGEARHYALISLLSAAYVLSFVFQPARRWSRAVIGAAFFGCHFFAFPLVAAGLVYDFAADRREGRAPWRAIPLAAIALSLGTLSVIIGPMLIGARFPGQNPLTAANVAPFTTRLGGLVADFFAYWEMPGFFLWPALAALLAIALRGAPGEERSSLRRFGWMLLAANAFLLSICFISDYSFLLRYFSPFFGVPAAFLLLTAEALLRRSRHPGLTATALLAALALFLPKLAATPGTWRVPAANFTEAYQAFERLKRAGDPVLFVLKPCSLKQNVEYYWNYSGEKVPPIQPDSVPGRVGAPILPGQCTLAIPPMPMETEHDANVAIPRYLAAHPGTRTVLYVEDVSMVPTGSGAVITRFWAHLRELRGLRTEEDYRRADADFFPNR